MHQYLEETEKIKNERPIINNEYSLDITLKVGKDKFLEIDELIEAESLEQAKEIAMDMYDCVYLIKEEVRWKSMKGIMDIK